MPDYDNLWKRVVRFFDELAHTFEYDPAEELEQPIARLERAMADGTHSNTSPTICLRDGSGTS